MKSIRICAVLISALFLSPLQAACANWPHPAGALLQRWFEPLAGIALRPSIDPRSNPLAALARFYRCREYQPSWVDDKGPLPQTEILLQAIHSAPGDGLPPMDYNLVDPAMDLSRGVFFSGANLSSAFYYDLARLDVALTAVMLKYAAHLSQGRTRPDELTESPSFNCAPSTRDLPGELARAVNENRLENFVESLIPRQRAYHDLKKILKRYQQIQTAGGWPQITSGAAIKFGALDARVAPLRRHLVITGDLPSDAQTNSDRLGPPLVAAVKRYQHRHGLAADGVVGPETLAALNIPVEDRIIQVMLNMERWRWFPEELGARYIMVNIPGFELQLVENEAVVLSMRAIVGRESRPTPILTSQMTYLELNPYWNIPQKIARKDILPNIQADPEYLVRKRIRVFDSWQEDAPALDPLRIDWSGLSENYFPYRLRQQPAGDNALGRIKFMFPNRQSVYIHDTPGKSLFGRPRRPFSSGCVRVEDPLALAYHLLMNQRWDRRKLAMAVESKENRTILLQSPVPVHLVYFTAWMDADGEVQLRDDIYDHDRRLLLDLLKTEENFQFCSARVPNKENPTF